MNFHKKTICSLVFSTLTIIPLIIFSSFVNYQFIQEKKIFSLGEYKSYYNKQIERKVILPASFVVSRYVWKVNKFGNVHFGDNNWLFYLTKTDGNPLEDLLGIDIDYNKIDKYWGSRFQFYSNLFNEINIDWGVYIAPNKSRIYRDYLNLLLPRDIKNKNFPASYKNLEKVLSSVDPRASYISPDKLVSIRGHEKRNLYHKTDTHWNVLGASYAYNLIAKKMNLPVVSLDSKLSKDNSFRGDIFKMLNAPPFLNELYNEKSIQLKPSANCKSQWLMNKIYLTSCSKSRTKKTLLIVGDSFRTNFAVAASEAFSNSLTIHIKDFSKELLEDLVKDYKIDHAIVVRVERYIRK